jgi:hypothetical protein
MLGGLAATFFAVSVIVSFAHAAALVHTVRVAPIAEPVYAIVSSSASAGQYDSRSFVPQSAERLSFAQSMERQNVHLGAELRARVEETLTRAGLPVSEAAADAELSIRFSPEGARYSDAVLGDDFAPSYLVILRVSNKNAAPREFRISYGEGDNGPNTLYPDAGFRFTSPDALTADPSAAAEGLRAGLLPLAAEIAAIVRAQMAP